MNEEIKNILKEIRRYFENQYPDRLERILLYGSQARGDAEPGSDVDLLVVLKGDVEIREERSKNIPMLADILLQRGVDISCVYISSARFHHEQSPLLLNARREGIEL